MGFLVFNFRGIRADRTQILFSNQPPLTLVSIVASSVALGLLTKLKRASESLQLEEKPALPLQTTTILFVSRDPNSVREAE